MIIVWLMAFHCIIVEYMHFVFLLVIVGFIGWAVSQGGFMFVRNTSQDNSVDITAPIDAAQEVVNRIESRGSPSIDLRNQGLTKVPAYVFDQTDATSFDVSQNALTGALQAEVRLLKNLRTLDLSHNIFTGVPAEVGQLTELEVLDLSYNPITGLPHEIGNFKNLKTLDLRGTEYSTFDLEIIRKNLSSSVNIIVE